MAILTDGPQLQAEVPIAEILAANHAVYVQRLTALVLVAVAVTVLVLALLTWPRLKPRLLSWRAGAGGAAGSRRG